jgi:hypothetical protein
MDNVKNKVNSITTGTVVTDKVSGITQWQVYLM